jgi:hypothetical protein
MFEFLKNWTRPSRGGAITTSNQPAGTGSAPYYVQLGDGSRVEIISAARAAASENLPDTTARELDDVEGAIEREHRRQARAALEQARGELRDLTATFDRLELGLPAPRDLHALVTTASAAIDRERSSTDGLVALHREQSRRHRDLLHLKSECGLARAAIYPVSRLRHWAMLAPLLVLEALANGGFFAVGNDHGLLGGLAIALFVSFLNIALGCTSGYFCFRWRRQPDPRLRRIAAVGIGLYVVLAIAFNLAVARYRDLASTAGATQSIGLRDLLTPERGMSLASAALLLVGLLASAISAWKGFRADDPTPQHGERDRHFQRADEALRQGRDRHHQALLSHAESVPEGCRAAIRQATHALDQMGDIAVRAERCGEGYDVKRESVGRWCTLWLKKYRVENTRGRTTAPPAHFAIYPTFSHELDARPIQLLHERLARNVRRIEELKAAAHEIELGQPGRVRAGHEAFEDQWADVGRRAESRHGNGTSNVTPVHQDPVEVSRG